MHTDITSTHVISCIYHIGSSEDSQPWPIVIEDYAGHTNAVVLKPGDMLLYESAKNSHGRPYAFHGSWYTSVFVHFFPKHNWSHEDSSLDSHFAIPLNWRDPSIPSSYPKLELRGIGMLEPDCPDYWCNLQDAVRWEGPGEYGQILTAGGERYALFESQDDDMGAADGEL